MNKKILGIDINDSLIAAVILQQRGRERQVVSCASIAPEAMQPLSESLPILLEKIDWKGGDCVCGLPLADISIRNLVVPFADKKKISQVLSFELEDQLISPASKHIIEYVPTGQKDGSSHILVTAAGKDLLADLFAAFDRCGLSPGVLGLRHAAFAGQVMQTGKAAVDMLFIDAGLHSMDILVCHRGEVVFLRHLVYPEKMVTDPPFQFSGAGAEIINEQDAMECIRHICRDINRSLGFFGLESGLELSPEKIVMTGLLSRIDAVRNTMQTELAVPVVVSSLKEDAAIMLSSQVRDSWDPVVHDFALSLALEGLQKKHLINFRKEEFAAPQMFFTSKGRLLAAALVLALFIGTGLGYLALDYHSLKTRYEETGDRMQALFKETFPDRTRITDPLMEMQASIKNIQAPSVAIPVFTGSKRSLDILADISGRIPASIELQVSRLVIDQESVQMKGTTNTFNNVNIIQNNLRRSPLFQDVDIISAAADKESKMIRFEVRMETGGA